MSQASHNIFGFSKLRNKFWNEWKWISVFDSYGVKCTVVLDQLKQAIFFFNKKDRCCHRWLRETNTTSFKIFWEKSIELHLFHECHIQVHLSGNNVPIVMPLLNHTSLPSTAATFLATCLMVVLQPSGYSVFHGGDTPIQLSLPWRSCSCQCLNTKTSARGNRGVTTETPSISYSISLYIRLVVTL